MIIVEGPDGAGKTSLVEHLEAQLGLKRKERGPRDGMGTDPNQKAHLYNALSQAVLGHSPAQLFDRLYFSELVYGSIWRNEVIFSDFERNYTENVLRALRAPIIFCLPPYAVVRENIDTNPQKQLSKVAETLSEVYDAYGWQRRQAQVAGLNVIIYDYTAHDREKIVHRVGEYLDNRKGREW